MLLNNMNQNHPGNKRLLSLCAALLLLACFLSASAGQVPDLAILADLASATLCWNPPENMTDPRFGDSCRVEITDRERLGVLETLLSQAYPIDGGAGCPFYGACILKLITTDGRQLELEMAWDSCSIFRFGEHEYNYKPLDFRDRYDVYPHNDVLFDLFTWQEKARNLDRESLPAIEGLYRDWLSAYGQPWLWSFETWVRFIRTFEPLALEYAQRHPDRAQPAWLRLMQRRYTWNGPEDLPYEDAVSIAVKAVRNQFGFSREETWQYEVYARFARISPEQRLWLIHLMKDGDPKGAPHVRIDAQTGWVLDIGLWPEDIGQDISFME